MTHRKVHQPNLALCCCTIKYLHTGTLVVSHNTVVHCETRSNELAFPSCCDPAQPCEVAPTAWQ
eukprot:COSAG06_NODE_37330_length_436_cov_1.222552_1_plen_63_part_10